MSVTVIDNNLLGVSVQNGESRTIQKGFVFIYRDDHQADLLGVCCVEVHSLKHIQFTVRAGEEYDYNLQICNVPNE